MIRYDDGGAHCGPGIVVDARFRGTGGTSNLVVERSSEVPPLVAVEILASRSLVVQNVGPKALGTNTRPPVGPAPMDDVSHPRFDRIPIPPRQPLR